MSLARTRLSSNDVSRLAARRSPTHRATLHPARSPRTSRTARPRRRDRIARGTGRNAVPPKRSSRILDSIGDECRAARSAPAADRGPTSGRRRRAIGDPIGGNRSRSFEVSPDGRGRTLRESRAANVPPETALRSPGDAASFARLVPPRAPRSPLDLRDLPLHGRSRRDDRIVSRFSRTRRRRANALDEPVASDEARTAETIRLSSRASAPRDLSRGAKPDGSLAR